MSLTPRQQEARAGRIAGSDAAAVLGVSPWKTPLRLYAEKVWGIAGQQERRRLVEALFDAPSMDPVTTAARERGIDAVLAEWTANGRLADAADEDYIVQSGKAAERVLASVFGKRHGVAVRRPKESVISIDRAWMAGTVDCRVAGRPRTLLECKRITRFAPEGRLFAGFIPDAYMAQAIHYMAVHMGAGARTLAGKVYGPIDECVFVLDDRDTYRDGWLDPSLAQPFDAETAEELAAVERRFVEDHVLARVPPPAVVVDDGRFVLAVPPKGRTLTSDEVSTVQAYIRANAHRLTAAKAEDTAKAAVFALMGTFEEVGAEVGRPLVTWRKSKDRLVEDWRGRALDGQRRLDLIATAIDDDDGEQLKRIKAIATDSMELWRERLVPGSRVLRVAKAGKAWLEEHEDGN